MREEEKNSPKENNPEENNIGSQENESIDDILKSFQKQKDDRERGIDITAGASREKEQIDFAKTQEDGEENNSAFDDKKKKKKKKPKKERKKIDIKSAAKKVFTSKAFRIAVIAVLVCVLAVGAVFGIGTGIKHYREKAAVAYLEPYKEKYPDVEFPEGILEEYCDLYGQNQKTAGKITISDIGLEAVVTTQKSDSLPYAEGSLKNSAISNYVVYLQDNSLEEYYKDADAYNKKASGFMQFNNMFEDQTFLVVGAFYTNTKAEDDSGYIFPYNVTEKMTPKSTSSFIDRLSTRFMYSVGLDITRDDILLTVSCPTDYREDFRFVTVAVMRNGAEKPTAKEKTRIRCPQVIFDEMGEENPYRYASQWYPEIVLTSENGTQSTVKQSIKDYE